jgi:hypothetical protein
MNVCLLLLLCVVRLRSQRSLPRADHLSRGVLPSVVFLSVFVKPRQWGGRSPYGLLRHDKEKWCCLFREYFKVLRRQNIVFILQCGSCSVTEIQQRDPYREKKNLSLEQRQCKVITSQAFRAPGRVETSRLSRQSTYEASKVVSLTHRPPLPAGKIVGTHFNQLHHHVPPRRQSALGNYSRDFSLVMA